MSLFALLLLAAPPAPLTLAEAQTIPALELAPRLLPAEVVPKIVKATATRQFLPGNFYWFSFWERPKPAGRMVCAGMLHSVQIGGAEVTNEATQSLKFQQLRSNLSFGPTYPRPATDESCASVHFFATPAPEMGGATIAALDRLAEAIDGAKGSAPLPYQLSCSAEEGDDICADARARLVALPIDAFLGVSFDSDRSRAMGQPHLGHDNPTIEFGTSPPDAKSWSIRLVGPPGPVERVEMNRHFIVRH